MVEKGVKERKDGGWRGYEVVVESGGKICHDRLTLKTYYWNEKETYTQ